MVYVVWENGFGIVRSGQPARLITIWRQFSAQCLNIVEWRARILCTASIYKRVDKWEVDDMNVIYIMTLRI